jgi:capsular polysaccharide biosynthesis protein
VSEQAVDLRSTWAVLRRRSTTLVVAAVVGAIAGFGVLFLLPPPYSSTSVVLLSAATDAGSGKTGGYDAETQVLIATSAEILSRAAQQVRPELTQEEVSDRVDVEAPAPAVVRITARGPSHGQAEDLAAAVSQSLVEYLAESDRELTAAQQEVLQERLDTLTASLDSVNEEIDKARARIDKEGAASAAGLADAAAVSDLTAVRASTVLDIDSVKKQLAGEGAGDGQVASGASVIQPASAGKQASYLTSAFSYVLGGAVLFTLLAAISIAATNQRDPKLRSRDEIADAVGIPVVASVRTRSPRTASAWMDLLRSYEPGNADGWALRQMLHTLLPDPGRDWASSEPFVLVVVTLSGDSGGLAVAPQIAAFAATNGISTQFHAAQEHESAVALWAAASQASKRDDMQPGLTVTTVPDSRALVELSVRLLVLDRDTPEPDASVAGPGAALLAVSSASVTRHNLADAVVATDRAGITIEGIVVANPDPLDRTTGRLSPIERTGSTAPRPTAITSRAGGAPSRSSGAPAGGQRRRAAKGRRTR